MPEHVKIGLIANLCMLFVFAGCMVYTTASKDESLLNRTNYEVMFFTAGRYSNYGTPMFQVEHHYFSSYD